MELRANFVAHCIPEGMEQSGISDFDQFLQHRRILMAEKIRDYYKTL